MEQLARRRRLGLIAIAVAALASAATSASPSPTPDLISSDNGTFTLTAESPVAWIDVSVDENKALLAAEGRVTIHVTATPTAPGVLLVLEDLSAVPGEVTTGQSALASGSGQITKDAACPAGKACDATIRLAALLLDPVANPTVDVNWTGQAWVRFPQPGGPVPEAAIDVVVGSVETRPVKDLGFDSTDTETIEVDQDTPRVVRDIHLTLPGGPVADARLRPGAFLQATDPTGNPSYLAPVSLSVLLDGEIVASGWDGSLLQPFGRCEVGEPCEVDLSLEFTWNGGVPAKAAVEWSLAAWPGVADAGSEAPAEILVTNPGDLVWDTDLSASTSGQVEVTKQSSVRIPLNATLDLSDVEQRAPDANGLIRLTFRSALAQGAPANSEIFVSAGDATGLVKPGEDVVIYTRADQLVCGGRSRCEMAFDVRLSRASSDLPAATVDWTAEVEFMVADGAAAPEGADLSVEVGPPAP